MLLWYAHGMDWRKHISVDPDICHGKACVTGTRIMVSVVLSNLAAGSSADQVAADYRITTEDVAAVLNYAAELAEERTVSIRQDHAA